MRKEVTSGRIHCWPLRSGGFACNAIGRCRIGRTTTGVAGGRAERNLRARTARRRCTESTLEQSHQSQFERLISRRVVPGGRAECFKWRQAAASWCKHCHETGSDPACVTTGVHQTHPLTLSPLAISTSALRLGNTSGHLMQQLGRNHRS